jgi:ribosome modulation factor
MKSQLRERVGAAMRAAYAQRIGDDKDMVPWEEADSRPHWLACADVAILLTQREIAPPGAKISYTKRSH